MANYKMHPDEGVILKSKSISHGFWGACTDEIMLTNQNFVWTSIGIMGFPRKPHQYPLHQIKVFDGRAQARKGEHSGNGSPMLEISFMDGSEETFGFQLGDKEALVEINKWIVAINKAVTGSDIALELEQDIEETDNSLLGAFREIKEAFIGPAKDKQQTQPIAPLKTAVKCSNCGASISGMKGQIVRCLYCDGEQQL